MFDPTIPIKRIQAARFDTKFFMFTEVRHVRSEILKKLLEFYLSAFPLISKRYIMI